MKAERKTTWRWGNWTFGPWYAKFGRDHVWGIDVGPFEIVWRRREPLPQKQLHPRVRDGRTLVPHQRRGGHPPAP